MAATAYHCTTDSNDRHSISERFAGSHWVSCTLHVVILFIGTVGHIGTIVVLLSNKRLRSLSSSVYQVVTSLAALAALYLGVAGGPILQCSTWPCVLLQPAIAPLGCLTKATLACSALQLYMWLQTIIVIKRIVAVKRPLFYKSWCLLRSRHVLLSVTLAATLCAFNIVSTVVLRVHDNRCQGSGESETGRLEMLSMWPYIDVFVSVIMPASIFVPCNVTIALWTVQGGRRSRFRASKKSSRKTQVIACSLFAQNLILVASALPRAVVIYLEHREGDQINTCHEWEIYSWLQNAAIALGFLQAISTSARFRSAAHALLCRMLRREPRSDVDGRLHRQPSGSYSEMPRHSCSLRGESSHERVLTADLISKSTSPPLASSSDHQLQPVTCGSSDCPTTPAKLLSASG